MEKETLFVFALCAFLSVASFWDLKFHRIPNSHCAAIGILGVCGAYLLGGAQVVLHYLLYGTIVMLVFYPLFRIGTIGGGDVKLYGVCSGFFPRDKILYFLFFSLLVAAIFGIVRFVRKGDAKERFTYLILYVKEVLDNGQWKLYWKDTNEKRSAGICLAGPILISVLLYAGGYY